MKFLQNRENDDKINFGRSANNKNNRGGHVTRFTLYTGVFRYRWQSIIKLFNITLCVGENWLWILAEYACAEVDDTLSGVWGTRRGKWNDLRKARRVPLYFVPGNCTSVDAYSAKIQNQFPRKGSTILKNFILYFRLILACRFTL